MIIDEKSPYAIGIDLGTGSCKTVLINLKGQVVAQANANYPSSDVHNKWEEQRPDSLIDGVIQSVVAAIKISGLDPKSCLGLSVGGAFHSLTALDRSGIPLTGILTWADNRAWKQAERIRGNGLGSQLYKATGCPPHTLYPFYKILWFQENHPELFDKAAWFLSAKEYILYKLTGQKIIDYSVAGASGLLNVNTLTWDKEILSLAGLSVSTLSSLSGPTEKIGLLKKEIASQMGLPFKTPVYLGSSDAANSSLGVGAVTSSQATCMIGTSGALRTICTSPILDPKERLWCYPVDDDHWLVGGSINNGGIAVDWLQQLLSMDNQQDEASIDMDKMIEWAAAIPAGAEGLICMPFFAGERSPNWDLYAQGAFFGFQLHHTKKHMCRALLEGIAFRLRSVYEALDELVPGINEIRVSGGFVQSPVWLQITADIINRPLKIPAIKDTSAIAAAYWVLLGSKHLKSFEELGKMNSPEKTCYPLYDNKSTYLRQYQLYTALYTALKPIFALSVEH